MKTQNDNGGQTGCQIHIRMQMITSHIESAIFKKSLLIVLVAITGCNFLSSRTEIPPFIEYKEGLISQYEYEFSILYPDSAEFIPENFQLLTTTIIKTDDEIVVHDSQLSGLINMEITVDHASANHQKQNVWYRYDDGFFKEYAYTRPSGYTPMPKVFKNDTQIVHLSNPGPLMKLSPERMITGNFNIANFETDSIRLRTDPRLAHPRAFDIGLKWIAFSEPWLSKSSITDKKDLIIKDSLFTTYEIETASITDSSEFTHHTYFDRHGLVKRVVIFEQAFTNDYGDSIGHGAVRSKVTRIQSYIHHFYH
jgi:hypothetical protein